MTITKQQQEELVRAARPLVLWLQENCHPHCHATVDGTSVELFEGIAQAFVTRIAAVNEPQQSPLVNESCTQLKELQEKYMVLKRENESNRDAAEHHVKIVMAAHTALDNSGIVLPREKTHQSFYHRLCAVVSRYNQLEAAAARLVATANGNVPFRDACDQLSILLRRRGVVPASDKTFSPTANRVSETPE